MEATTPGFRRGRNLAKIGMKAQDTSELFYDEVRVPMQNRLGAEGQGFGMLMTNLARERLVQAVRGTILAEEAIRWTVAHTRERKAFGRTIADFQNTRFVLAELAAKTTAARAMTDGLIALPDGRHARPCRGRHGETVLHGSAMRSAGPLPAILRRQPDT